MTDDHGSKCVSWFSPETCKNTRLPSGGWEAKEARREGVVNTNGKRVYVDPPTVSTPYVAITKRKTGQQVKRKRWFCPLFQRDKGFDGGEGITYVL